MSLGLLYRDELRGYVQSRAIVALFVGLPVLSVILHALQPAPEGIPLSTFVAILVTGIGGTLAAVLLSTTITSERERKVYDLFLVRPVRRWELLLAKYLAVLTCLVGASGVSLVLAGVVDVVGQGAALGVIARAVLPSLIMSVAGMAVACSVGVLFGVVFSSVAVSAILSVYLGNQLTSLVVLPTVLVEGLDPLACSAAVGIAVPVMLLTVAVIVFNRKAV